MLLVNVLHPEIGLPLNRHLVSGNFPSGNPLSPNPLWGVHTERNSSLFFMTPPLPPCEHLPAVAPGGNLLSFSISGSSLSVSHRGSSSSWMEPFPSALRASSTGLLL